LRFRALLDERIDAYKCKLILAPALTAPTAVILLQLNPTSDLRHSTNGDRIKRLIESRLHEQESMNCPQDQNLPEKNRFRSGWELPFRYPYAGLSAYPL